MQIIVKDYDIFGNYKTNAYPCPRCGATFLVYVEQFYCHNCEQCDWCEASWFFDATGPEEIDYDALTDGQKQALEDARRLASIEFGETHAKEIAEYRRKDAAGETEYIEVFRKIQPS